MALASIVNTAPVRNTAEEYAEKKVSEPLYSRFALSVDKAKEQLIRIAVTYLERNEDGSFAIPFNRQRPIMLMGPAGIGKTDVPRQAAQELGIGFVSYSMTHHTRQSALGLPKIVDKSFGNKSFIATEYTMSEIIGAVYDEIERSGKKTGILFLDEINCVPESLSAVLLQLFQNKSLGQRSIPQGWILVLAGNPPEYNKSVKQFDAVTHDRLRIINVMPDAKAWLKYAEKRRLNPAIRSFIASDERRIYHFETNDSKIVTPRAWEELSISLDAFERRGFAIEPELIAEFIGSESVVSEFHDYYKLVTEIFTEKDIEAVTEGRDTKSLAGKVSQCTAGLRHMLIICFKQRLHRLAQNKEYEKGSAVMDNIMLFLETAYGKGGDIELFVNDILSDPEIVLMAITSRNKAFGDYINNITESEASISESLKKRKRREAD